jgi:branched-chain amino acid transport system substrate-binding protein
MGSIVMTRGQPQLRGFAVSVRRVAAGFILAALAASTLASCSTSTTPASSAQGSASRPRAAGTPVPADSATKVSCPTPSSCFLVGNVATIGGPVPGLFKGALVGTDAYLAYRNSLGGLDGRKFKLLSVDDQFSCENNRAGTQSLIQQGVIAIVGSFSLQDNCGGQVLKANPDVPDVSVTLDPAINALPNVFSVEPLALGMQLGPLEFFKQRYPNAITRVGTIVAGVSTSEEQWAGEKAVFEREGYRIVYERFYGPLETDFTGDVLKMEQLGVRMVLLFNVDAQVAARFLEEAATQGFHPELVVGGSGIYASDFVQLAGGPQVADGTWLVQTQSLYLGGDEASIPEVGTFLRWVHGLYPGFVSDLFALYGWTSAELFVDALARAGATPSRASLMGMLRSIDRFDADGLLAPADPAQKVPPSCYLIARVEHGTFRRVDMPPTGYRCDAPFEYEQGGTVAIDRAS